MINCCFHLAALKSNTAKKGNSSFLKKKKLDFWVIVLFWEKDQAVNALGENGVKPVCVKQRRDETLIILEGNSMLAKTEV